MLFACGWGPLSGEAWQAQVYNKIENFKNYSNWWVNFFIYSQNVKLLAIQKFAVNNKKDFIDSLQIHKWGVLDSSFKSSVTKWLMWQKDIDFSYIIAKIDLYVFLVTTTYSIVKNMLQHNITYG